MEKLTLILGDKNYSSWSIRPYLALAHTGAAFEEVVIPFDSPNLRERILPYSPSGKVPALRHGELLIWESLAICEYIAELFPEAKLWPEERAARALARAVSAEMHAGFADLRREMPVNLRARTPKEPSEKVRADVDRIVAIWRDCRGRFGAGGPFLFGRFSIADAMFAPVVTRFISYSVGVDADARAYMDAIVALPAMRRWAKDAGADLSAG